MTDARTRLIARLAESATEGGHMTQEAAEKLATSMTESMTDAQVDETLARIEGEDAERVALRERLRNEPALRQAVCPGAEWKSRKDRFDVAARAVRIIEFNAEKHAAEGVTVTLLAEQLVAGHGTIADTIALHGVDPRNDDFGTGNFYAFRFRVKDALDMVLAPLRDAERARVEAKRDADWAAKGMERCDRCGGVGGAQSWPGYTCYKCDGLCAVPIEG